MSSLIPTNVIAFPTIAGVEVTTDDQGRFNLNAIHRAYEADTGTEQPSKAPAQWLRGKQAQEFVSEVEKQTMQACIVCTEGRNGGTYATKSIAIAYAAWIGGARVLTSIIGAADDLSVILKALSEFEIPEDAPDMYVYAIRERETGNVKLGISRNPQQRLRQLQTGNSSTLELVAYRKAENRFEDEKDMHADAANYRLHGEWFDGRALDEIISEAHSQAA